MVNGILEYLWLVPALPLLGVVLNGAIALFAERPLLSLIHISEPTRPY